MANTKTAVERVKERTAEIFANREKETRERQAAIDQAKAELAEIEKRIDQAVIDGNAEEYTAAKHERLIKRDVIEMSEKRLKMFKESPLIEESEYQAGVESIETELKNRISADKKRIVKLLEELREIAGSERDALNEGNNVLRTWQASVNRWADAPLNNKGDRIINSVTTKRVSDYIVVQFADWILSSGYYGNVCKDVGTTAKPFTEKMRMF